MLNFFYSLIQLPFRYLFPFIYFLVFRFLSYCVLRFLLLFLCHMLAFLISFPFYSEHAFLLLVILFLRSVLLLHYLVLCCLLFLFVRLAPVHGAPPPQLPPTLTLRGWTSECAFLRPHSYSPLHATASTPDRWIRHKAQSFYRSTALQQR